MRKVSSTISHAGLIGLALLALLIATVVWLFERLWTPESSPTPVGNVELEILTFPQIESSEPNENSRPLARAKDEFDAGTLPMPDVPNCQTD